MSNQVAALSPVEAIAFKAVSGKVGTKAMRDAVEPGVYTVNRLVRLQGEIKVGEDYDKVQANKVDFEGLFAVAMSKLNDATVASIVREFEENKDSVNIKSIKAEAQAEINKIKGRNVSRDKGKVTHKLTVEAVNEADK